VVNASLNWASVAGILLILAALPGAVTAGFQIAFLLGRRKDTSVGVAFIAVWGFLVLFARLLLLPLAGSIFFFQGWRLDSILQSGLLILVVGYLGELVMNMISEHGSWQSAKKSLKS
jgi:Cu/Ag efflux pump CusA